jgi:hypothetical protein
MLGSEGVITSGTDTSGLFGTAGASLAGKSYKLSITYDDFSVAFHSASRTFEKESGPMTGVVTVTVGGVAFTPDVTVSFGALLYANNNGSFSELFGFQSGNDAQGQDVYASQDLSSTTRHVTRPEIRATCYIAVAGDIGSVTFATSGPEGTASFTATPSLSWMVYPPSQLIDALMAQVDELTLRRGHEKQLLLAKLNQAKTDLANGNGAAAVEAIEDFIHEVERLGPSREHGHEMIREAEAATYSIEVIYSLCRRGGPGHEGEQDRDADQDNPGTAQSRCLCPRHHEAERPF